MPGSLRVTDGSADWSGGINSGCVTTLQGEGVPNGLPRNMLAFATNCTMRGGSISPRFGWRKLVSGAPWSGLYQGGYSYQPDEAFPHLVLSIGGQIWRVRVDEDNRVEHLPIPDGTNPPLEPMAFFVQGEQFLIIQAGDYITNPLFYDGDFLRRSTGITSGSGGELPPAGPMDYFMGRIWYAIGRTYVAGDIVNGPSGTVPYRKRDSILKVTENPLALTGDGFIVPTTTGNIRALRHTANLDTALGQGSLFIFTRKAIYVTDPPVTRALWGSLTEPLQRVAQNRFGSYGDRCIVPVNGDLFYQSTDGIRSLFVAVRNFTEWGNTPISRNINRALVYNNRALMRFSSGVEFDNRLLQAILPVQTPVGVAFGGLAPLDFDLVSSLGEKLPPAWEGLWEGLQFLQLFEGDFGGLQRCFAVVVSQITGEIEVWELTQSELFDEGDNRIQWQFETPSFTWGNPLELKQLDGCEIWIDRVFGDVRFIVEYRVDQSPCWLFWHSWRECTARDCREDLLELCPPSDYPQQPYCPSYRANISLPAPPIDCSQATGRPSNIGYQFQVRVKVKGSCRVRGVFPKVLPREKAPYDNLTPC